MTHHLVPVKRVGFFTRQSLKKFSKSRLISIILALQSRVIKRATVGRVTSRRLGKSKHKKKYHFRKNSTHWVNIRGKRRKVRVLANGRWKFLKTR